MQNGTDAESVHFQEMADHGHYGGREGQSRQGIYVCAPNGHFLASINSTDPDRVLAMMQRGLRAWNDLPADERKLSDEASIQPEHRWEDSYPVDGLVLTMITRDLPENCDPNQACAEKWNQDQVWFSQAEARQWLPDEIQVGSKHQLPQSLRSRLLRLHLVDTVKGQTVPFSDRDISTSEIEVEIIAVNNGQATLKITGKSRAESSGRGRRASEHGVETSILGHATCELDKQSFSKFEFVALGKRWGFTTYNGRRRDDNESPVGFVFQMVSANEPRIAPAFVYGYNADWIKQSR